ncbi:hypothetical protein [Endozoicomonas sp. 4G]|uniref:hypothetical protein n=1 Tax=Endozoicomonas sp. 4G TaxID=2872754 RepID=UPI0020787A32|nr:hypothetical protein [Endozoicomonas sp. 4G]
MSSKVIIFDTSVLCCWLQVPGKDTCGPEGDHWNFERIEQKVSEELQAGSTFVLPLATIIETGNHIAFASGDRYSLAKNLSKYIHKAATDTDPWAAFGHQSELWGADKLIKLAESWPDLAIQGLGIGDTTIKDVADYYASTSAIEVEILTGDKGLKSHQPVSPAPKPRRRR